MKRSALALLGLAVCVVSLLAAVADGTARTNAKPATRAAQQAPTRVLFIGDSLSVGAFGEAVQRHLARVYGPQNVASYASCGSSPENWLASEPGFYTKCGYRQSTPDRAPVYRDFVNGHAPRPTLTPKLETLVRRHDPTVVVVQLGTNWMDRGLSDGQINSITDRFVRAARSAGAHQIVWIEPPDSSAFRRRQDRIHRLIQAASRRDHFDVIDSRELTHYTPGRTGGDGIHYNTEASGAWAARLTPKLDAKLSAQLASKR
ncbi:MAG: SGNH/GDSL hydrolase family protein [Chthoniobacterales bacterium]